MIDYFSPYPPTEYTRNGLGHGDWFKGDLAKWNLAWLCTPNLDLYLKPELDIAQIMGSIDHEWVGISIAALEPEVMEGFPNLREYLEGPRRDFFGRFIHGPWGSLPGYQTYGMKWVDTIRGRVSFQEPDRFARAMTIESQIRASNVFDFSKYLRR